ncbi:glycosyltransferase family 4 protein [Natrarchaeobaculum aegyptiacum]|uniref:Glycosyl transferase family 1 n=1 Tax=Natrarchaeobaculum aegyptiacum TaxID=745377 RepID=A0A2Z2HZ36_9EURY|nr:glycosyltransferase family 4 protein [Natrarchaeobaculum aegyptiacum]ARS88888.1 glycosyl transferase family 1 [Natrarchaeobaculum aegyptiacum]
MEIAVVSFETVYHRDAETNRRLHRILQLLQDQDHEIDVYCARFWEGDLPTFERDGITYHGLAPDLESQGKFLAKLPTELARTNADVVHLSADPAKQVLAARSGTTLARVPTVLEWYGAGGVPNDWWSRRAAKWADRIVTPSELVGTWVRELGADGDDVDVVPNPIDVARIRSVDPGDPVDVVYARDLDEDANLESLFLALAELRDRDWSATVIGDGPERDAYERLASDLRIDDRVTFAGDCSLEDRIATYRGARVFVQTAEHCVFPTEMLWALTAGCVGIVEYHTDSSAHELVEGWDRGFRTTSAEELADAIVDAGQLEQRDFDDRFADYDEATVRDRYLTIYRSVQESAGLF